MHGPSHHACPLALRHPPITVGRFELGLGSGLGSGLGETSSGGCCCCGRHSRDMQSRVSVLEKGKGKVALVGLGSGLGSGLRSGLGLHAVVPDEGANFLQLL